MQRSLAITVLVLVQTAPMLCWHLPTGDLADISLNRTTTAADRTTTADSTETAAPPAEDVSLESGFVEEPSVEQYGLLPTPNIATPILDTVVLPETFRHAVIYKEPAKLVVQHPASPEHARHEARLKRYRNIDIRGDGALWTRFPNNKHLVEIVPIKHKTKKGKALAYIVPKSHSVKKKLKKQERIAGIVVNRNIVPDLSEGSESVRDDSLVDSSESKSSESDSDSFEMKTSEELEDDTRDENYGVSFEKRVHGYDSETKIKNKLNDIVSYYKEHKDVNLNTLIHDVLPDDEKDPEYHVHYIIHKKPRNDRTNNSHHKHTNLNTHDDNLIQSHNEPDTLTDDNEYEQIHVYPKLDKNEIKNEHEIMNHVKIRESREHSGEHTTSHTIHEHEVKPLHTKHDTTNFSHNTHTHPHYKHSSENIPMANIDQDALTNNLQVLVREDNPDLYKTLVDIVKEPEYQVLEQLAQPELNHIHVYAKSEEGDSNRSENLSSETDSGSTTHESTSGENYSTEDMIESEPREILDSIISDSSISSENASVENILSGSESAQNYNNPKIIVEGILPEDYITQDIEDTTEESGSSESAERDLHTHHDSHAQFHVNGLPEHGFELPNCLKLKKRKTVGKCEDGCDGHKSYTLTFLFNR